MNWLDFFGVKYDWEWKEREDTGEKIKIFTRNHVSGHASREDHRKLLNIIKPEHIIPCHGDMVMKGAYSQFASGEGYELNKNIHLINNGLSVEI